jgi:hypothetical protein
MYAIPKASTPSARSAPASQAAGGADDQRATPQSAASTSGQAHRPVAPRRKNGAKTATKIGWLY